MREWNDKTRFMFNETIAENGLQLKFISKKTGIANSTLCRWRYGNISFAQDNLKKVTSFCEKYIE